MDEAQEDANTLGFDVVRLQNSVNDGDVCARDFVDSNISVVIPFMCRVCQE
jgi:hypothetical protein